MAGKIKYKEVRGNYKFQLYSSFFAISILAIIVTISISFSWFQKYIYKEINNLAKSQLDNINTSYDMHIQQYRKDIYTMYENPVILRYLYDNSDFTSGYNASRYLQTILSKDASIDYILLFHGDEIIMNTGRVFPSSKDLQNILQKVQSTTNDEQDFLLENNNEKQLAMIQTERKTLNGESQYGIILIINLQKMQDKFISREENSTDAIYILNRDGYSIVEKNDNIKMEEINLWENIQIANPGYFSYKTDIEGKKYIGNYLVNEDPRYVVLTLQDMQSSEAEVYATKRVMIMVSIILLLVTTIVSYFLTQVLYKPFEQFWKKISNNSALILPGENLNEITKMDTTIDRIIERVSILSQQLDQDEVIRYLQDDQKEMIMPRILELQSRNEQALLILVNIVTGSHATDFSNIKEVLESMLANEFPGCKICIFQKSSKSWLIFMKELTRINFFQKREEVKERYHRVIEEIKAQFHVNFQTALSETISDDRRIEYNYRLVENYLRYHLMGEIPEMIDQDYVVNYLDERVPMKITDNLMHYIREGQPVEAVEQLALLLEQLRKYTIKHVLLFLAEFATYLNNINKEFAVNSLEYKEHYLENYLKILAFNNREELMLWMSQIITNTCLELRVGKEKTLRTNMIKSIEYIQSNYLDRNISVEVLAEEFHISVSYFSKLFREYTGTTFPEYVNDLRMNYAKDLMLQNPTASIKKISDEIGFSSVSYFSSQFKKKFAVSPSQYRNNL